MRSWIRDRGLLLANLALFVVFFGGMIIAGVQVYNNDQSEHGQGPSHLGSISAPATSSRRSSRTGRASSCRWRCTWSSPPTCSSEDPPNPNRSTSGAAGRGSTRIAGRPERTLAGPPRWLVLKVYENSLCRSASSSCFWRRSRPHAAGGRRRTASRSSARRARPSASCGYLGTSQFWFESFQNWQSEFLAVATIVGASVYLRQRGSAESKPVAEPHAKTGS